MNIIRRIFTLSIVFSLLIIITSCRSSKTVVDTSGELTSKNRAILVEDVINSGIKYKTISGKVNLELKGEKKSQRIGAQVKIIKDEAVQLSIRALFGVEAFRLTFTPDSVFIINRLHKVYVAEDMSSLEKKLHFNFYNLQALFTNSIFIPGQKSISKKDYDKLALSKAGEVYMLGLINNNTTYNFAVDASDRIVSTLIFDKNKNTLQWSYGKFIKDKDRVYPSQMLANIETKDKRMDVGFEFPSLDFDKELKIDYSLSSQYQKVSLSNFIMKITSLMK